MKLTDIINARALPSKRHRTGVYSQVGFFFNVISLVFLEFRTFVAKNASLSENFRVLKKAPKSKPKLSKLTRGQLDPPDHRHQIANIPTPAGSTQPKKKKIAAIESQHPAPPDSTRRLRRPSYSNRRRGDTRQCTSASIVDLQCVRTTAVCSARHPYTTVSRTRHLTTSRRFRKLRRCHTARASVLHLHLRFHQQNRRHHRLRCGYTDSNCHTNFPHRCQR